MALIQEWFVPSFIEIDQVRLEKYFHFFSIRDPSHKLWSALPYLKMFYAKIDSNRPNGSGEGI